MTLYRRPQARRAGPPSRPAGDERRFIDVANSPIWLGEEIVVIGAP